MYTYIFVLIMAIIIYLVCKSLFLFWYYKDVPGPRPRLPIVGSVLSIYHRDVPLSKRIETAFCEIYEAHKYDGMALFFLGNQEVLYVFKPALVNEFLKDKKLTYKSADYFMLEEWLGGGLLVSEGKKWKNDRKMLNPCFNKKALDNFIPCMNEQCRKMVCQLDSLKKDEYVDVRPMMTAVALNILLKTVMGVSFEYGNKEMENYSTCLHTIQTLTFQRLFDVLHWNNFIYFKTPTGKLLRKNLDLAHKFTSDIIKKRKSEMSENENFCSAKMVVLDHLLSVQKTDGLLTDKDIRQQIDTFGFAGHDPSAICLQWTLLLIANHVHVQEKLKDEMNVVFGNDTERDVNVDDLNQLQYTECVIKESLRLFTPPAIVGRKATKDFVLNGYKFRKGASVFISLHFVHRDEEAFKDPDEFRPERFSEGATFTGAFLPFVTGPRSCIGQRFAMNEMTIILAHILRRFTIKCLEKVDDVDTTADINVKPMGPIRVCFRKN